MTNPEDELVKVKFTLGLRDLEAKLGLSDGIKAKPTMALSQLTENLQFTSQLMASATSSQGNKPIIAKEEVGYNFKITFRKPSERFGRSNAMVTWVIDVEVSHAVASCFRL